MQKKYQKLTVYIIIGLVCISLIGSSFVMIFQPTADQSQATQEKDVLKTEYDQRVQVVELLTQKVKDNPEDIETQQALGDAYYNKARITVQLNNEEYQQDLKKAIEVYQKVLIKTDNSDVKFKLATSAFLLGDSELAGKTYSEVLAKDPENVDALYGYGLYLFYDKKDTMTAKLNWQKALNLTTDDQMKERLMEMITLAEGTEPNTSEAK